MQGMEFQADLRLISLGGCDMVLGIQWLAELEPILWDFKNLKMEFTVDGRKFVLRGATSTHIKLVSADRFQKELRHKPYASTAHIFSIQLQTEVKEEEKSDELSELLQSYS